MSRVDDPVAIDLGSELTSTNLTVRVRLPSGTSGPVPLTSIRSGVGSLTTDHCVSLTLK